MSLIGEIGRGVVLNLLGEGGEVGTEIFNFQGPIFKPEAVCGEMREILARNHELVGVVVRADSGSRMRQRRPCGGDSFDDRFNIVIAALDELSS